MYRRDPSPTIPFPTTYCKQTSYVVPGGGIEPPWSCFRRILSPFLSLCTASHLLAYARISHYLCCTHTSGQLRIESHQIAPSFRYKLHQNRHHISLLGLGSTASYAILRLPLAAVLSRTAKREIRLSPDTRQMQQLMAELKGRRRRFERSN